jgi:hypothetical protein
MMKWLVLFILSTSFAHAEGLNTVWHKLPVTVLSESDAQKLFVEMKGHSEIAFEFIVDGCIERAHEMSRLMLLEGIMPIKAFAYVESGYLLQAPRPMKNGQPIEWWDHVAPAVLVNINGELIPYVIDPSIENKAVPSAQWMLTMTKGDPKSKAQLRFGTATTLVRYGAQIDFNNQATNQENLNELKHKKILSQRPHGEEEYLDELQRNQEKMAEPAY